MTNLLFVSIAFPPKNDPECLQTAKYFKYLVSDKRLSISVVTSSVPTLYMNYDRELEKYNQGYRQQINIPIYESKILNFILRKILPNGIDFPDSKFSFHLQAKTVFRKLHSKPDVIYSRSNPLSSSLLAFKLKMHYNVPWIMHLSDPWVGSPIHHYSRNQLSFHQKWQDACFHQADFICFTSHKTIDLYGRQYPQLLEKLKFFPNVFDPEEIAITPINFNGKLRIVYTGGLAGKRSPRNFLRAYQELISEHPKLSDKFEIIFAGPIDRESKGMFDAFNHPSVSHIGNLPYSESKTLMMSAHVLMVIDLPIQDHRMAMFFPSKILDYFLTGRKILALTTQESVTWQTLKDKNSILISLEDTQYLKHQLISMSQEFERKNENYFKTDSPPPEFSASLNASRLLELILKCNRK